MKKAHLISLFIGFSGFVGSNLLMAQESWQSQLVTQDKTGNLTYQKDKDGFVIPDFSQAGYKNGKDVPVINWKIKKLIIRNMYKKRLMRLDNMS